MAKQKHKPKFRGVWCPAEAFHALQEGRINCRDLTVLLTIEALTNEVEMRGCIASNKYLAGVVGLREPTHMSRIISRLKKMDFVVELPTHEQGGKQLRNLVPRWVNTKGWLC